MPGLTEAVVSCARSSQLNPSMDREGVSDALPLTEELLADSSLGAESNVFAGNMYLLVDCHAPVHGQY